ncbi:TldD protein, part of TldE/TldD proteolytic complex [uncultured Gammaproteobacteria bacterium]|nr:TldD protein, part of TldE/TldD proteolytic complex [uncultured Gammaproteobacteria bacterium]
MDDASLTPHIPMPRMTNTYMLNGEDTLEQMIASVDDGLYAVNFDGGQVDITSGKFVFSANEAYLIKNGKISHPVKVQPSSALATKH